LNLERVFGSLADGIELLGGLCDLLLVTDDAGVAEVFRIFEAIVAELAAGGLEAVNQEAIAIVVLKFCLEVSHLETWVRGLEGVVKERSMCDLFHKSCVVLISTFGHDSVGEVVKLSITLVNMLLGRLLVSEEALSSE